MEQVWIGTPSPADVPALKRLFSVCFGDPQPVIDSFFALVFRPEETVVLKSGGQLAAAGYCPSGLTLQTGGTSVPCGYLYAMGTFPAYRGQGFGRRVAGALQDLCRSRGEALLVLPAEPVLYPWYREATGSAPLTHAAERAPVSGSDSPSSLSADVVDAVQYQRLREALLDNRPHVSLPTSLWDWQQALCRLSGGGLFRLGNGDSCAVCERDGDTVLVRELLCPETNVPAVLAALRRILPAKHFRLRLPVWLAEPEDTVRDFVCGPPELSSDTGIWFGPVFD